MAIKSDILADGGRPIRLVQTEPADKPEALAVARAALCIAGVGAGVVMAGGDDEADEILRPRLVPLMSRGLVHAARGARRQRAVHRPRRCRWCGQPGRPRRG